MPSINEMAAYVTGVVKMARNEAEGLNYLDLSTSGFWRSFWAYAYSLPAYLVFWLSNRAAIMAAAPHANCGTGFFVYSALSDAVGIALGITAVALVARPMGIADRFVHLIVSANWLSLPLAYVMAAGTLLTMGTGGESGSFLLLIIILGALAVSWRVFRVALGGDGLLAFGLLVLMELVFVITNVVLG